ncbi:MAG: hypothetical protein H6Q07_556 [Acidobacteria bacterium]|nr:hypothetical protein [Acidobacteriota bacterium]
MEGEYGVPTAPIVTARFADYVIRDGRSHGMNLRWTFPPYPVGWVSRETLHGYVQGNDPVTKAKLMTEIVDALTKPLTDAEKNPEIPQKPKRPRLLKPDSEANLNQLFLRNGWTDGLPVVLPTEERVAEMLAGTDHDPQEVVGMMSVTTHEEMKAYTVEKVAINAVMAGARPEHLPVILAIASTQHPAMPSSTGSYGSMVVVNGPVSKTIGMNSGVGAMGPFNYANSVIGRAWTLMSINFGDARAGDTFMAAIGNGLSFTNQCCAENEGKSPWKPFHVRKGFKASESTVSIFRGWNVLTLGIGTTDGLLQRMNTFDSMGTYTFVVDPLAAKTLKAEGWGDPDKLSRHLAEKSKSPFLKPEGVNFIVVGGETNPIVHTTDYVYYKTASVDEWIPKGGIKLDAKPLRMPAYQECEDGLCFTAR